MSPVHLHAFDACTPTVLGHYLQALGLFRIVSEQADAGARAWWENTTFRLATELSAEELTRFLLHEYSPSPILCPWNGGSGFYPKDRGEALAELENGGSPRFRDLATATRQARRLVADRAASPKEEEKKALLQGVARVWRGAAAEWAKAAFVITDEGAPSWPSLLGSGGNDGRLDFSNNFHQHLVTLFAPRTGDPRPGTSELLLAALFGTPTPGSIKPNSIGQYHPAAAGGANSSTGFEAAAGCNSWAFVLMMEGTLVLQAAATARLDTESRPHAAAPFAVRPHPCGSGSGSDTEAAPRGEQWLPIWRRPASYAELRQLLREGRARINGRTAQNALDFARALGRLGVARGISRFERFGYMPRNGQANLAVHLGSWATGAGHHQNLLDDVAPWADHLQKIAGDDKAPARLRRRVRLLTERMVQVTRSDAKPRDWQALLRQIARVEEALLLNPKFTGEKGARPADLRSPSWWETPATEDPEWRLAVALASLREIDTANGSRSLRHRWIPLREGSGPPRFAIEEERLRRSPEEVARGVDLIEDLAAIVHRILGSKTVRAVGPAASLPELMHLLEARVDTRRLTQLARALMAVRAGAPPAVPRPSPLEIPAWWSVLRVGWSLDPLELSPPHPGWRGSRIDAAILARLRSGAGHEAFRLAVRRLVINGLSPRLTAAAVTSEEARRAAACLLFPLHGADKRRLANACLRSGLATCSPTGDER